MVGKYEIRHHSLKHDPEQSGQHRHDDCGPYRSRNDGTKKNGGLAEHARTKLVGNLQLVTVNPQVEARHLREPAYRYCDWNGAHRSTLLVDFAQLGLQLQKG